MSEQVQEIPVECGERWEQITQGVRLPEHEVMRIKSYLSGMNPDDLVYTRWFGPIRHGVRGRQVSRLVIVGSDGAGRRLRREEHTAGAEELLDDVAAVQLCAVDGAEGNPDLRYVFIDCAEEGDPILLCRREDFTLVYAALRERSSAGTVWRGYHEVNPSEWESIPEGDYLFPEGLAERVLENSSEFLGSREAEQLSNWKVPPRRGVVLHGQPGNGKTVLTRIAVKRALAAGVNVNFLNVSPHLSVSENLNLAASRSPALIVIDDIDIHCGMRERDAGGRGASAARQMFLAALLEFLDGVSVNDGYVLLATTNSIEELDPALVRPGRLDVHIEVGRPSGDHRQQLLQRDVGTDDGDAPKAIDAAAAMEGCSYADLAELVRRYKIAVLREHGKQAVDQDILDLTARRFAQELEILKVEES